MSLFLCPHSFVYLYSLLGKRWSVDDVGWVNVGVKPLGDHCWGSGQWSVTRNEERRTKNEEPPVASAQRFSIEERVGGGWAG
jgi:hypothetical protein